MRADVDAKTEGDRVNRNLKQSWRSAEFDISKFTYSCYNRRVSRNTVHCKDELEYRKR